MTVRETVLIIGASSQIGVFLLPRLDSAGFAVLALSRRAPAGAVEAAGRVKWINPAAESREAAFLVSCGPLRLACRAVEDDAGFKKVVAFSTSSLLTKADSADGAERKLLAAIAEEEGRLKSLCGERGIALVLVRPTLVYGCGLDRNLTLLLKLGERTGFIPVSRRAAGLRQPVHADDLAGLAAAALAAETGHLLEGEACGGSTLPYREMVQGVASCGTRRIRTLSLPESLLSATVKTAALIGPWKGLNPEMVRRQTIDMTFDDAEFRETLAYNPRPFNPIRQDFEIPPHLEPYRLPQ